MFHVYNLYDLKMTQVFFTNISVSFSVDVDKYTYNIFNTYHQIYSYHFLHTKLDIFVLYSIDITKYTQKIQTCY